MSSQGNPDEDAALLALARAAVLAAIEGTPPPRAATARPPCGVFVTLERDGRVLGCRGSLVPRRGSLEEEIVAAATAAAAFDPRYGRRSPRDLPRLQVTLTRILAQEPLGDIATLTPGDGLALTAGSRTGIVLPWEGRDPRVRLEWAYRKAGVAPGTAVTLRRLRAERVRG